MKAHIPNAPLEIKMADTDERQILHHLAIACHVLSDCLKDCNDLKRSIDEHGFSVEQKATELFDVMSNLQNRFISQHNELESLREKIVGLQSEMKHKDEEINSNEGSTKELKAVVLELQQELQAKDVQISTISSELSSQIREGESYARQLSAELEDARMEVRDLEKQVDVLHDQKRALETQVNDLKDMESVVNEQHGRIKELTDGLSRKDQEIEGLMQALDEEEKELELLENKSSRLEQLLQEKELALKSLDVSRTKALSKLTTTVDKFDELHSLSESLLAGSGKPSEPIARERDSEISFLRQEVTRMQSKDSLLQVERTKMEELLRKSEALEASLSQKDSQLGLLRRDRSSSQPSRSIYLPGTSEIEQMNDKVSPAAAVTQIRGARKAHGFKSLTMSHFVPKFTRPISDRIDGMWHDEDASKYDSINFSGTGGGNTGGSRAGLFRTPISGGVHSATAVHDLPPPALAVRNLMEQIPGWSGLSNARVTIFGDVVPLPAEEQEWAHQQYVSKHQQWASQQWGNFYYYRMHTISDIYFIGGFGTVAWIDVEEYEAMQPDKIAIDGGEHNLKELNTVFSKPLKELLSTEGEVDDVALISMDSKGIDIRVRQGAQFNVQRIAFEVDHTVETLEEAKEALRRIISKSKWHTKSSITFSDVLEI
ncbi:hypothetical protein PR202_ga06459 [Eleusine coracana subsp. coracana]|uniref:CREG-like beta-barrel domain-containing protein n=1 Tax=Eleusine coracana subsp. coracana TaxID=191504 RepID=A0AAV5BVG1_ELECO|nr:hypothetical protein PR202_ga06459 [Eleusine coracana subsp. coracana]